LPIVGVFNSLTTGLVVKPNYKWENYTFIPNAFVPISKKFHIVMKPLALLVTRARAGALSLDTRVKVAHKTQDTNSDD
jgi:hypothetical protein